MTLPTGPTPARRAASRRAFTLIELILVLALLAIIASFVAPALGRFARGRTLDAEARQILALTRAAQSRAVSDGTPMLLWLDTQAGSYGLRREWAGAIGDAKPLQFRLDPSLRLEPSTLAGLPAPMIAGQAPSSAGRSARGQSIRFTPEGSMDDASPQALKLSDGEGRALWLVAQRNRMGYEIRTDLR